MTEDQFRQLAETFGADIARWPTRWRADASVAAREPWAASILREASMLDDLIGTLGPEVDAPRANRSIAAVNARIAAERQKASRPAWFRWLAVPVPGIVAAALLGAYLGLSGMTLPVGADTSIADLLAVAFSYSDPSFFVMGG